MISYSIDMFCDGLQCHKRIALTDIDPPRKPGPSTADMLEEKAVKFMGDKGWYHSATRHYCPDCMDAAIKKGGAS